MLSVENADRLESQMDRCMDLFEDYCIVTQSVRSGIDVMVEVRPHPGQGAAEAEAVAAGD